MNDIHDDVVLAHVRKALEQPARNQVGLRLGETLPGSTDNGGPGVKVEGTSWQPNALGGDTITFEGTEGYVGLRRTHDAA
jgi:hypothetical protein